MDKDFVNLLEAVEALCENYVVEESVEIGARIVRLAQLARKARKKCAS